MYNEAPNIAPLLHRLRSVTDKLVDYQFEFIFTDNASEDNTFALLYEESQKDSRIKLIRFARNFGFQKSIMSNYLASKGDAVIQIDADLQDPPELIEQFLDKWKDGYKVVYGIRRNRQEGAFTTIIRKLGYIGIDKLSEVPVPRNAGDFRLLDRDVIESLAQLNDQTPYLRGLVAYLGYNHIGIPYNRDARIAGKSKFGLFKLISLGIDGVCSQSTKLLRLITIFGVLLSVVVTISAIGYIALFFLNDQSANRGFTTLALLSLLSIAINSVFLGVIGEYVGRTFNNTRSLPMVVYDHEVHEEDTVFKGTSK